MRVMNQLTYGVGLDIRRNFEGMRSRIAGGERDGILMIALCFHTGALD